MKILHTSDWHLGQNFMSHDRRDEHAQFLDWLTLQIKEQAIDVLIIAGDIFDTGTPPNYAEEAYFKFLADVSKDNFIHVIIVGGNHDSVATLHAPKKVLRAINVDVVGCRSSDEHLDNDVITIKDESGNELGFICCVPFLRERDLRKSVAGESYEDKSLAVIEGTKKHYGNIYDTAVKMRDTIGNGELPIIATGHLFAAGGATSEGVRDIYVGNLGQIGADAFNTNYNYVALGHLHKAQKVGGCNTIRYCGSPIPLSFSEANSEKQVLIVDCSSETVITPLIIPEFRKIRVVKGDINEIELGINALDYAEHDIWLEVQYDADENITNLESRVGEFLVDKAVELFAIKNVRKSSQRRTMTSDEFEHLDEMKVEDVFERKLNAAEIADDEREELRHALAEILNSLGKVEEVG